LIRDLEKREDRKLGSWEDRKLEKLKKMKNWTIIKIP
jgi:hypothetical protein